ncbi:MAG: hypothetical protein ACYCOY_10045 [Metallibacterium sp.]
MSRAEPITQQPGRGAAADGRLAQAAPDVAEIALAARAARDLAALGVGLGLDIRQATARACDALARHGGTDVRALLGIPAIPTSAADPGARHLRGVSRDDFARIAAWLQGREQTTCAELIDGAQLGDPANHGTPLLAGRCLRALGWSAWRPRWNGGRFVYRKPAAH